MSPLVVTRRGQSMHLTIEELSEKTRIKVPTIRYYERSAVITPDRNAADPRAKYVETDVLRLHFLKYGRSVGLVLAEIRAVLEMTSVGSSEELDVFAKFIDDRAASLHLLSETIKGISARICRGETNEIQVLTDLARLRADVASSISTDGDAATQSEKSTRKRSNPTPM
jgi:DNA-binding transcriptional MerR regulator